ncbi:hypothetical protein Vafri_13397 [Volvox africanus]|nr:hypothetical protein Vafri_13397 [Volvox africanus]
MSADFTGDKPSALDTLAEDLGRAVLAAAAKSGDPLTGAALGPNQLRVLVERTCEVKEQLEDYLRYLQGALTVATAPRPEEQRAPAVASPRQGHDGDMDVEDPTLDTEADDQETATDRRGPKAAAAAVRTDRGRGARGTSGAGRQRRSSGAGQSTDPVRGKRKGDSPSAAVVHKAGSGTKRQRTDDNWLSKWGCTRSELECRRRKGVCLRCASDHVTRECPLLPAYTPKLDQ